MRYENQTKVGNISMKHHLVLISGTVFTVLFLIISGLIPIIFALSEPIVTDNLNGSFTADWPLENSTDYNLYNLTMQNGAVNLTLDDFWWNQTTQGEFETGSLNNINTSNPPNDLVINSKAFGVSQNYIKNGRFETSANWSYFSSDNITAEWNASGEYGWLHHYSASNPPIIGDQNVSAGSGTGAPIGLPTIPECLEFQDGTSYYQVDQGQQLNITNFYIGNRTGRIKKVVLNGVWRAESGYSSSNSESLRYKDEGGTFQHSSIVPTDNQTWNPESQDITNAHSSWTWSDIANLEVSFLNDDTGGADYVEWDSIWLEVTVERFDQTAYINQTFDVLNTTGFNDTDYIDFSNNMDNNSVNFSRFKGSVVLDYSGAFTFGQAVLHSNASGANCTWIYNFASDENYGISQIMWVGGTDLISFTRGLVRFNLSSIPANAIILNATMQLWVEDVPNKDINVSVHRLTKDWDEGYQDTAPAVDGVTWDVADTDPLTPWVGGGEFNQTIYNLTTVYTSESIGVWHDFNITTLAQEWINGTPNYGLIMKHSNEPPINERVKFTSDDGAAGARPKLVVSYVTPHHYTYGNFSSQIFNAGKAVDSWGNISWNADTPPSTTIALETRTGNTLIPDASWDSWSGNYTQSGDGITSGPGQYIQYRAHLETSDTYVTPELYDVTIIFERTNLSFDYLADSTANATEAVMSITIDDTEIWTHNASVSVPWTTDTIDISEWILEMGFHNISLRFHLEIDSENEVNYSLGYDNILMGTLGNEIIGEYISIGFDAGSQANWDEISWSATLLNGTDIIIQTRSSPDNASWGPWSAAYMIPGGDLITSVNDRYIQYIAILLTKNESNSPILHDVSISYHRYRVNGTLEMINDYIPAAVVNWGQFSTNEILNGQTITFWYSTDSGGTWILMPINGDISGEDTSSGTIRFRAEFFASNTSISPELLHFSLLYFTNNPPQLMNIGYTNEPGAFGGAWFNFTVMYLDEENSYPAPLKVHITGPAVYNLTMNDLDSSDFNLTDGKWFYYNLTLPKGSYQYRIVASDGAIWNITSFSNFTVNNNPPELKYINVWPPTGPGGTTFNYTVVYFDKDDDPPDALLPVNLTINGSVSYNVTMMELDSSDTTYSDGKDYYYSIILVEGTYDYFISAFDGEDWATTGTYPLIVTNNPPMLDSPSVLPSSGYITTTFTFTVIYIDLDNDTSGTVTLNLSGPSMSGPYIMTEVDPADITYTDGKLYNLTISGLAKGIYTHHFAASDMDGSWVETAETALPEVLNSEPEITTGNIEFTDEDMLYSAQYQYIDADNDSCIWLLETNASWLSIDPNTGYLNGTPNNGDVGWFWVIVTVSDNDGGLTWTQFTITVNNTPPQITTTAPTQWAAEGYLYIFDFEGEDEGEGNAYWTRKSNASWLSINDSSGEVSGIPGTLDAGSFWVNVTLYDGNGGFDNYNYTIWVNDTSPPVADAGLDDFTYVGLVIGLDGSNSWDNSGQIANYTWYFGDGNLGFGVSPAHVYWDKGVFVVTLVVTDPSGNQAMDTTIVTVLNTAPQISTGNTLYADEDILYSVHYDYTDIDSDICSWILETNATWLAINPATGYLNGTPTNSDVGSFWVNVTVDDNDGGQAMTSFILIVNNTLPQIITTSPPLVATEGQQYTFEFNGEDEGEGSTSWSLQTNASWLSINASTGTLSGIPQTTDIAWFWVNVTLDDGNGGYDYLNFIITVNDVSPPVADAGSDDFTWEDSQYIFNGSASTDNSGQIVNYTWYFGDGSIGYGISPSHVYINQGVYLVILIVTDETANEGFDTMKISVFNVDPVANAGPDLSGNEGEPVSFDASSSSDTPSDNAGLVYVWDFDSDGDFDDGFGITSTYTWLDEGFYIVSLKVIDDNGNFSRDFVNVIINNLPPTVGLEDSYSGMEGDPINFLVTASDPGNDQLLYRWDWDNDGVNDTQWSNKPYTNNSWVMFGTYTINVEVWDGDDGYANTTADVTVIRPEQPPVISGVGGRYVRFGYPFILDLGPYINDPDTPKDDLTVTTSDLTHIDVNGLILTLTYPESMKGQTRVVTITVSDGKNTDNDTLTATITDNFPPEVSGDIPDVSFDEGETLDSAYDLDNYFIDKDGDPLDYTVVGNIHVRPVIDPSTHTISFSTDPNWYGVEDIIVRAYDPKGAFVEQVVRVTVNPVNFPPTIGGIQDVYIRPNSPWELRVLDQVYVWDDDSILDLSLFTNSSFVTPSPTKEGVLVFYYIDPLISIDIVEISVSDGEFTASTDVVVHISITNWPPYIKDYSYPSDVRFDEDTQLTDHFDLNDYFADNSSDSLTFTQIVPESNLIVTIDYQGRVSFSASENWFGQTTVTFRAQDTAGAWASFTINVTVSPINDPPEILAQITYLRIEQGETWIIDLDDYFTDLESGGNLTFSSNKASIKIDPVTHEARWERDREESLDGLIFTASDGEDSVSTEPVNLKVVGAFNWLWVVLAAVLGALVVFAYRGLRYRYRIEEVLLVDHAGILLSHLSRGKSRVAVDAELVSGMLTAVQDFVKDSFLRGKVDEETLMDKKKSLEKLEFAGHHLVMEQGSYSFICAVISGTVNKRLRKKMRDVLGEFETEYKEILSDWDGVIERFEGVEEILKKLIPKGEKPPKIQYPVEELKLDITRADMIGVGEIEEESPIEDLAEEESSEHEDNVEEPPDEGSDLPPDSPSFD